MAKKSTTQAIFTKRLFTFLMDLEENNNRNWFESNKPSYEDHVRTPALEFIQQMQSPLKRISAHFDAISKKVGGSLMRVHRDIRFSKNKQPYKTNVGIQFRHEFGKDVHAPGYYVHLHPDESFLGVGIWHPSSDALQAIRAAIDERPSAWKKARDDRKFLSAFHLAGDSLKRPPRGFTADHPLIDDLKRKDFIAVKPLSRRDVHKATFVADVAEAFRTARPLMRFLCRAINVPF
ncbi:MAG: DUF2461 domain-containing protein [Pirellulales bacterium]|nr:DUF2461 domain-containing protein [Pirellulales bacterium]